MAFFKNFSVWKYEIIFRDKVFGFAMSYQIIQWLLGQYQGMPQMVPESKTLVNDTMSHKKKTNYMQTH